MTTVARDPWADAWQAATQPVLDPDLVAACRRIWFRRLASLVATGLVLLGGSTLATRRLAPGLGDLWSAPLALLVACVGLTGAGLVLMCVGVSRSRPGGRERSFVGPEALLPRADRAWVRTQIAEGLAVPAPRRDVVLALALRMRAEGRYSLTYLGLVCMFAGMVVGGVSLPGLIVFSVLVVALSVLLVRARLWSSRARRWLTRNA